MQSISNEQRRNQIASTYGAGTAFEKSEGARGGKVVGHTKSGKPIYDHNSLTLDYQQQKSYKNIKDHAHQDWSWKDHVDASNLLSSKKEKAFKDGYKKDSDGSGKARYDHSKLSEHISVHDRLAKQKFKKENPDYNIAKFDKEHNGYKTLGVSPDPTAL